MILFISLFLICIVFYPIKCKKITLKNSRHYYSKDVKYTGNNREIYLIIVLGILFLVCGLRDETIGVDTINYIKTFKSQSVLNTRVLNGEDKFEIGYKFLVQAIRIITDNVNLFIFICAAITFIGLYFFLRDNCKDNYQIALLIFMAFLYYTTFSALRQSVALAIGINSITFLKKGKWIKATLLIIIGALFHSTELVLLIMIPLSLTKWNKKKIYYSLAIGAVIFFSFSKIMNIVVRYFPVYDRYTTSDLMDASSSLIGLFSLLTVALISISIYKLAMDYSTYDDDFKTIMIISIIGSVFAVSFDIVSHEFAMLSRVTRYFIPYIMVLAVNLYSHLNNKRFFNLLVIMLMGIYFVLRIKANIYGIIPYKTFV